MSNHSAPVVSERLATLLERESLRPDRLEGELAQPRQPRALDNHRGA
jgi:hypothetical protein